MTPHTWTVELPPGLPLLNANRRVHWRIRHERTRGIRWATRLIANEAEIPALQRAHIIGEFRPPDRRRRDIANMYPSFKAAVDGLVDARVLPDDSDEHLVGPDMRVGPVVPGGQIVLHITALEATDGNP